MTQHGPQLKSVREERGSPSTGATTGSKGGTAGQVPQRREAACPDCDGTLIYNPRDGYVCDSCGLVAEGVGGQRTEQSQPRRSSANYECVETTTGSGRQRTTIGHGDSDLYAAQLSPDQRDRAKRLKWTAVRLAETSTERTLRRGIGEVKQIATGVDLPEHAEKVATNVYKTAFKSDRIHGRDRDVVAAAAVLIGARTTDAPVTAPDVCEVSQADETALFRRVRRLVNELDLPVSPLSAPGYLGRLCSTTDLSDDARRLARQFLKVAQEENIHSGVSQRGLAAAALYLATGFTADEITQAEIAQPLDVSTDTVRERYQELLEVATVTPPQ